MASRTPSDRSSKAADPPSKKPSPVVVGSATAYAVRSPSASDPRWYWQAKGAAVDGSRPTLWAGRATVDEVTQTVASLIVEHGPQPDAIVVREAREVAAGLTVAQLLARWIAHVDATADKYSPNTRRNYHSVAPHLTAVMGGYDLCELRPSHLERYHSKRVAEGTLAGTASFALRALRTAWNWGLRERLHVEPWPKPHLKLRDRTARERPDGAQVADLLAILRADAPEWCWRLARVVSATGMRVSEAWGLEIGHVRIDRDRGVVVGGSLAIQERVGVAKTGARKVAIGRLLAADVAGWLRGRDATDRLIGDMTQSTATMGAAHYLRPAAQKLGASWTGWHALRRAAADAYAEAGVDPVAAAAQLGHTVQVMQGQAEGRQAQDHRQAEGRQAEGRQAEGRQAEGRQAEGCQAQGHRQAEGQAAGVPCPEAEAVP